MEVEFPPSINQDGATKGYYKLLAGSRESEYKLDSKLGSLLSDGLRERCASIDWDRLLNMESSVESTSRMALIGLVSPDLADSSCPSCRLLLFVSNISHANDYRNRQSQAFHQVCRGLTLGDNLSATQENFGLLAYYSHRSGEGLRDYFGSHSTRLFQVIPLSTKGSEALFDQPRHADNFALPVSCGQRNLNDGGEAATENIPPHMGGCRLVGDATDFKLCASWIEWCRTHHAETCWASQRGFMPGLRLIDCNSRELVIATQENEYVALSYVWGSSQKSLLATNVTNPGILSDDLPRVIEDALQVARQLGIKYLWTDKYCIDQQDTAESNRQIQSMDKIYRNAFLTIIAAAGEDSNHGLPGVGKTPRKPQPQAKLGSKAYAAARLTRNWETIDSVWETRAWTFQEGLLSQRRLIFDDFFAYFECGLMSCSEALDVPLENFEFQQPGSPTTYPRAKIVQDRLFPVEGVGTLCSDLWGRIEEYSTRQLTFESDSLNAMLGIFNHFSNLPNPVFHFEGLPLLPHWEQDGGPGFKSRACDLGMALLWYHGNPSERREQFPSWSWTGWTGRMLRSSSNDHYPPVEPDLAISLELPSKEMLEWDKFYDQVLSKRKLLDQKVSYLLIDSWTCKVELGTGQEGSFSLPLRRSVFLGKWDRSSYCDLRAILDDKAMDHDAEEEKYPLAEVLFPLYSHKLAMKGEKNCCGNCGLLVKEQPGGVYKRIGICYSEGWCDAAKLRGLVEKKTVRLQ